MSENASDIITAAALEWPGVYGTHGQRGEWSLKCGRREIGHLHGDRVAHFGFPRSVGAELRREGRIVPHPVFPDREAWGARTIAGEEDVREVIALLRLNYERAFSASSAIHAT